MADDTEKVGQKIASLIGRCSNLVIASTTDRGDPLSSQAPFAVDSDGSFLVLVSALAEHGKTLNLAKHINVMLMEDEGGLANPFARERLNYNCSVDTLNSGSTAREHGEQLLRDRFGNFIDTLIALPDFSMFRLSPLDGRYVAGFGTAYVIKNGELERVGGKL